MNDYKKNKGISSDSNLPEGMREQFRMCMEMHDLLPLKISKLSASLSKWFICGFKINNIE